MKNKINKTIFCIIFVCRFADIQAAEVSFGASSELLLLEDAIHRIEQEYKNLSNKSRELIDDLQDALYDRSYLYETKKEEYSAIKNIQALDSIIEFFRDLSDNSINSDIIELKDFLNANENPIISRARIIKFIEDNYDKSSDLFAQLNELIMVYKNTLANFYLTIDDNIRAANEKVQDCRKALDVYYEDQYDLLDADMIKAINDDPSLTPYLIKSISLHKVQLYDQFFEAKKKLYDYKINQEINQMKKSSFIDFLNFAKDIIDPDYFPELKELSNKHGSWTDNQDRQIFIIIFQASRIYFSDDINKCANKYLNIKKTVELNNFMSCISQLSDNPNHPEIVRLKNALGSDYPLQEMDLFDLNSSTLSPKAKRLIREIRDHMIMCQPQVD